MIKVRILHIGLAVLSLPLVLQVVCIMQLYHLVNQAEILAKKEARLTKSSALADEIITEFGLGWPPLMEEIFSSHVQDVPPFDVDAYVRRMAALLDEVRPLAKDSPEQMRVVAEGQILLTEQYKLMKRLSAAQNQGSWSSKIGLIYSLQSKVMDMGPHLRKAQEQLKLGRVRMEEARKQQEVAREQIKLQVLFAILAEIILTVVLIGLFLQYITRRLSVLVENARLIPTLAPLTKSVPGGDELAYLDGILHSASSELRRAAEHRTSLMQMVAHDLRTPLGAATLAVDAVTNPDKTIPVQERIDRAKGIKKILNHLVIFVEDLLTIDKLEAGKLDLNYDAVELRQSVADSFEGVALLAADKGIQLKNETADVTVGADRHRISQVLSNLLSNAIKFSPSASTITVSSETRPTELVVFVADQGPGVPAAAQEHLFSKYFQTQDGKPTEGFGLGLAICKMIIARHGGSIGLTSDPGKGSVFWFTLPLEVD